MLSLKLIYIYLFDQLINSPDWYYNVWYWVFNPRTGREHEGLPYGPCLIGIYKNIEKPLENTVKYK